MAATEQAGGADQVGPGVPSAEENRHELGAVYDFFKNNRSAAAIRDRLPAEVSHEKASEATLRAAENGILTPDKLKAVAVQDGRIHVVGTTPGFRASVDLSTPAPPAEEIGARLADLNQSSDVRQAQAQVAGRSFG